MSKPNQRKVTPTEVNETPEVEVTTPVEPVEAPIATQAPVVEETPAPTATVASNGSQTSLKVARLSALGTSVLHDLEGFVDVMNAERLITPEQGAKAHDMLWWTIKRLLLNSTEVEFTGLFKAVLDVIKNNQVNKYGKPGAFDLAMLFRYANLSNISGDEVPQYKNILLTMVRTCDPANRALVVKQINWQAVTDNNLNEVARARLLSFYRVA